MRWAGEWAVDAMELLTQRQLEHRLLHPADHAEPGFGRGLVSVGPPPPPLTPDQLSSQDALLVGLGFTAAVFAQIAGSIGLLLLKSSSLYEYDLPFWSRIRFFAGIFFQAIVPIGTDSFAYAVCPLSLLAPLSGITIAATIVFTAARCCGVREPVHASDFAVVILIIAGVTLVNIYGPHASTNVNVDHLANYLLNVDWLVFSGTCGGLALFWLAIYVLVDFQCLNYLRPPPTSVFMTLGCAFSAACCSMLAQVFLKVIAMSVKSLIQHNPFEQSELAPIIISSCLLVVSAIANLFLINATMKSGKVIIAVPSYSSLTIVLTIVGASIFYGDFNKITTSEAINFGVGVGIVGIGIILLSILQWCRQMRKHRSGKLHKPTESDSLLNTKLGKAAPSVSTERTRSEEDGGLFYSGDGASTFGDGASSYGDGGSTWRDGTSEGASFTRGSGADDSASLRDFKAGKGVHV